MNSPHNNVAIFGFLQKDIPKTDEIPRKSPMPPAEFSVSRTAPALGLNFLNAPKLRGFGPEGLGLYRTYHTAKFYDAPALPLDKDTSLSVPSQVANSGASTTLRTRPQPLRRHRALRGEPSDDRDHSDCSTTAVRGTGVLRGLRRTPVHFWPYPEAQRQNRGALHRSRADNYSTIAQAGSPVQSFYDRRSLTLSDESAGVVNGAATPLGAPTPLVFIPLATSHVQLVPDAFIATPTPPPVPDITPRRFAEASVQTDSAISSTTSNVSDTQPTRYDNDRKRSRDENDKEAEGSTRPLTRRRTGLGSGELMQPRPLCRSSGSTNI